MKTIEQFNVMKPEAPEYSDANHIYSMAGVDPLYYVYDGTQEKQLSPAAASFANIIASYNPVGNVIQIIPASVSRKTSANRADVFILTDRGYIYSYSKDYGFISLGNIANLGSATDTAARIAVGGNGYLLVTCPNAGAGQVHTNPLSHGGINFPDTISTTWTANLPGDLRLPLVHSEITPFQSGVAIATRPAIVGTVLGLTSSQVNYYQYDSGFSGTTNFKLGLGDGWEILRLCNYQNTYIAIGAYYSSNQSGYGGVGSAPDSSISYIYFWNTRLISNKSAYQFSVQVPGTIIDMVYSSNTLYVLSLDRQNNYVLYRYTGRSLKKVFNINFDTPSLWAGSALFEYPGGVGINLQSKGAYIYTENNGKEYRYLSSVIGNVNAYCLSTGGVFYGAVGSFLFYQPTTAGVNYVDMDITTHWIPLATKLSSINVWYETPPSTNGEYIRITASSWGEDQADGVNTQQLSDITSTAYDTKVKTTLDLKGLTGTMLKLRIQTHSVGAWRPIIRRIESNEDK